MTDRPVTLAAIIGAHGVAGEVRLKIFGQGLESIKRHTHFNQGQLTLKLLRDGSNGAIARFAEITDRNKAEAMRGTALTVPRSTLPPLAEGEYYFTDLLSLPCVSSTGDAVGLCVAVENFGADDVVEIETMDSKRFMVPIRAVTIEPERLIIDADFCEE